MANSVIGAQQSKSLLASQSVLANESGGRKKKELGFALNLTTLIDAFCILVIFLLSNMNGESQNLDISKKIVLPAARASDLMTMGTVIKIEGDIIMVDDVAVTKDDLVARLLDIRKEKQAADTNPQDESAPKIHESIIIQADKNADFSIIGDLLRAGGQAGYTNYMFAVWPGTK